MAEPRIFAHSNSSCFGFPAAPCRTWTAAAEVQLWLERLGDSSCTWTLVEARALNGRSHALVLSAVPLEVPNPLSGVAFDTLRAGDRDGTLSWLWQRLESTYE